MSTFIFEDEVIWKIVNFSHELTLIHDESNPILEYHYNAKKRELDLSNHGDRLRMANILINENIRSYNFFNADQIYENDIYSFISYDICELNEFQSLLREYSSNSGFHPDFLSSEAQALLDAISGLLISTRKITTKK